MLFCFGGCAASRNGVRLEKKIEDGLPIKKIESCFIRKSEVESEVSEMSNLARKSHRRLVITNTISLFSLLASIYANLGATTLSIMTLSLTLKNATLGIMPLSIMTLGRMALGA
jgi:hypothetical protein